MKRNNAIVVFITAGLLSGCKPDDAYLNNGATLTDGNGCVYMATWVRQDNYRLVYDDALSDIRCPRKQQTME